MIRVVTMAEHIESHRATAESRASRHCCHVAKQPPGSDRPVYVRRHHVTGESSFLCRSCIEFAIHAEAFQAVRQ